ncbi:PEP-CTERM putative exosortase interaction domain-containing protein [Opitutaceae bacterium TAV1]|nr:PEP-CTERM putative exosortase interaction domain-containing protein [Opitutaceae bacterium TAV1]
MNTRHLLALAALVAAPVLSASVLVQFDMLTFNDGDTPATRGFIASTVDPGVSATDLLMNNNITGYPVNVVSSYGGGTLRVGTWATSVGQGIPDVATTLANGDYITFTVTPLAGSALTLSTISFTAGTSNNNTPRSFYLFSSATGFEPGDLLLSDGNASAGGTMRLRNDGELSQYSVTLTSPAFANITGPTEFRIYIQTGLTNQELDFGNLTLEGSVSAVPEPSNLALLVAFGALGLVVLRRRR